MKMCELFSFLGAEKLLDPAVDSGLEVLDLTADTRKIKKGSVFFLLPRAEHKFADYFAQSHGALTFVHSKKEERSKGFFVENVEEVYFAALKIFYKESVEGLKIYGLTGTNGKTTTAFMLQSLLTSYGVSTGIYGTIKNSFKENSLETGLTSAVAEDFYRFNHENYKKGMRAVVCEVSSHALDQKRLSTEFLDGAGFTSFSQDHLDYHGTMEKYLEAKLKITTEALKTNKSFFVVSKEMKKLQTWPSNTLYLGGFYNFKIIKRSDEGLKISFSKNEKYIEGWLPLFGDYNASNFSMALTMLCEHFKKEVGEEFFPDKRIFENFVQIPGRMEQIPLGENSSVFIDFSHTPDSLEKALETLTSFLGERKLITVFGCGGDRDKAKRPLMGALAEKFSDEVVVTNDNPRTEIPKEIARDILRGTAKGVQVELDRGRAIERALEVSLREPCFVLIAGKGHEQSQETLGVKKHFSDQEEVLRFIKTHYT